MVVKSPAFVFIHGSWHTPEHLAPIINMVRSRGYAAIAPLLPSCDVSAAPNSDTSAPDRQTAPVDGWPDHFVDAVVIKSAITDLINVGEKVVVVAHSYGGVPASEAVTRDLTAKERQAKGLSGGVVGLFFMGGYLVPPGWSGVEWLQGTIGRLAHCAVIHPSHLMTIKDPGHYLYNDMSEVDQQHWSALLRPQPLQAMMTVVQNAGYRHVPCFYFIGSNDQVAEPSLQLAMIEKARKPEHAEDAKASIETYVGDTGHSPYLSWTAKMVDLVIEFSTPLA